MKYFPVIASNLLILRILNQTTRATDIFGITGETKGTVSVKEFERIFSEGVSVSIVISGCLVNSISTILENSL